jgi:hypothetical protein
MEDRRSLLQFSLGQVSDGLNTFIEPGSNLTVGDVDYINERGELVAIGVLPNGDQHAILLIPDGDCDDLDARIAALQPTVAPASPVNPPDQFRNRLPALYALHSGPPVCIPKISSGLKTSLRAERVETKRGS